MPAKVRTVAPLPTIVVPERVGIAMRSEELREAIPARVTLSGKDVPYAGETREAQSSALPGRLPFGQIATLATLRRAWELVGFIVDPGNATTPGLTASLRVLGRRLNGTIATVVVPPGPPVAFVGFLVGARCELVVTNAMTSGFAINVKGEIWGMAQR